MSSYEPDVLHVPPADIRPNDENPRLDFPEESLNKLAASIDEVGVLVPLSVFQDPEASPTPYVLIDGERRWVCSSRLGRDKVPVIVMSEPDAKQNLLTMFNIHMMRDEWADMPTAWALEKLIERTGTEDVDELSTMTGLSKERIKRLMFATRLPEEYQKKIHSGEIPLNFFYELQRSVIQPMSRERPRIVEKFSERAILDSFVQKRLDGVATDTVELRNVRPIIALAVKEAGAPEAESEFDVEIERLIEVPERTIQEAYEETVEMVVEADKFARQCGQLLKRFDRLMNKAQSEEDRELVRTSARDLVSDLTTRLA